MALNCLSLNRLSPRTIFFFEKCFFRETKAFLMLWSLVPYLCWRAVEVQTTVFCHYLQKWVGLLTLDAASLYFCVT